MLPLWAKNIFRFRELKPEQPLLSPITDTSAILSYMEHLDNNRQRSSETVQDPRFYHVPKTVKEPIIRV